MSERFQLCISKLNLREFILAIIIGCMLIGMLFIKSDFISLHNLREIYNDTSILIILALGQMLVIITRCIDLSVAANVALTGMVIGMLNVYFPTLSIIILLLIAAIIGAMLGMINGLLVWKVNIPAIVVTLGTMSIFRGIIFLLSDGAWINAHQMSESFKQLPRTQFLGLSLLTWASIITVAAIYYFLKYRRTGRSIYASGNNPTAAAYTGINIGKVQFITFTISGMLAGIAGYLWVSRYAVAYVDVASGFELQVIAACVIGGVSIAGGIGTVLGCVLGALFLGVINNALPVLGVSPFWQMAISGGVIIIAIVANSRTHRQQGRLILKRTS